jgi:hypothetical protein
LIPTPSFPAKDILPLTGIKVDSILQDWADFITRVTAYQGCSAAIFTDANEKLDRIHKLIAGMVLQEKIVYVNKRISASLPEGSRPTISGEVAGPRLVIHGKFTSLLYI